MKGRVSLYFDGSIVATRKYTCDGEKRVTICKWKRIYGKGFEKATVVDNPEPPLFKIRKTRSDSGVVKTKSKFKKGSIVKKIKIPKASPKNWEAWR